MRNGGAAMAILAVLGWPLAASTADEIAEKAKAGATCGTIAGLVCEDGLWCEEKPGQCGGMDLAGVCVAVPEICTKDYSPVCGCDGQTYGNDCSRRAARQQKDHDGECKAKTP